MQKLIKNRVFTLVICILLAILSLLMFLDGFGVGEGHYGQKTIHLITAVVLLLYAVFLLVPMVARYRGVARVFLIGEIVVLLLVAALEACGDFADLPVVSVMQVCAAMGLAVWMRGAVLTVRIFYLPAEERPKKPLLRLCGYILLSAFGVWQMARPLIKDKHFIFFIGGTALLGAVIFGYATVDNFRAAAKRAAEKKAAADENAAESVEAEVVEKTEEEAVKEKDALPSGAKNALPPPAANGEKGE